MLGCRETESLMYTAGENVKKHNPSRKVWQFLIKQKTQFNYYTKTCTQMFVDALFIIAKNWK